jgi:hypothetical protein
MPLDIFFSANLAVCGHTERGSAVIRAEESRIAAQVAGQDHQVIAEGPLPLIICA